MNSNSNKTLSKNEILLEQELIKNTPDKNMFHALPPLPLLHFLQSKYPGIHSFEVPGFCVGIANCPVEFPPGQHAHDDYEFIMPIGGILKTKAEQKLCEIENLNMMAFNTGQYHGPDKQTAILNGFICISCDKKNVENISYSIFGRREIYFANENFNFTSDMRLLLSLFAEEGLGKQTGSLFLQENLSNLILSYIIRSVKSNMMLQSDSEKYHVNKKIKQSADFLKEQYNSEFSLSEVSGIAGLSPYHFIRVFRAQMGKTPYEYLLDTKIEKAKELLSLKNKSITEICTSCGFNNPSHFSYVFRKKTGLSPSEYRRIVLIN
ncbi:MAG: AraC family transcriptional regulator [Bacillota bacterium]|nr:AraC family transcriptional regulator [Bacillota bacterium]